MKLFKEYWFFWTSLTGGPISIFAWILTPSIAIGFRVFVTVILSVLPAIIVLAIRCYNLSKSVKTLELSYGELQLQNEQMQKEISRCKTANRTHKNDLKKSNQENSNLQNRLLLMETFTKYLQQKQNGNNKDDNMDALLSIYNELKTPYKLLERSEKNEQRSSRA